MVVPTAMCILIAQACVQESIQQVLVKYGFPCIYVYELHVVEYNEYKEWLL